MASVVMASVVMASVVLASVVMLHFNGSLKTVPKCAFGGGPPGTKI